MKELGRRDLAGFLEHSVLAPSTTEEDVIKGCALARACGAVVMMVQPAWLRRAVAELAGSGVKPASVLSFPHGASLPEAKAFEAEKLASAGAMEIDMVINIGALKSGKYDLVRNDIAGVVSAAGESVMIKTILETALLTDEEIAAACRIAEEAKAAFVKTSTGFGPGGAVCGAVALMRKSVTGGVGVKASGGIRTLAQTLEMIRCGANRIGTSSTEAILREFDNANT